MAHAPVDGVQVWLFPQVLAIVRRWMAECVVCNDDTFPQLLLFAQKANEAAEKIHRSIAAAASERQPPRGAPALRHARQHGQRLVRHPQAHLAHGREQVPRNAVNRMV